VIVLRQAIGDFDTLPIIEGTKDFKILAWLLLLLILIEQVEDLVVPNLELSLS
jgi:hypothetical protein